MPPGWKQSTGATPATAPAVAGPAHRPHPKAATNNNNHSKRGAAGKPPHARAAAASSSSAAGMPRGGGGRGRGAGDRAASQSPPNSSSAGQHADVIQCPFDLAKRLRGAVQARDTKTLERLFKRPEASEMDDKSVAFVVRTAVEQHSSSALALLFSQPAVQSMGARAIAGLLQTAIRYKNVPAVLQLSKLQAAHDINTAYLSYLLEEAMRLGHADAIKSLSMLQGHQTELEQLVPAGSFAGALRTAVLQGRRQMVYHMSQTEAVQGMEPSIMAGILGSAIYHRSGVITRYLCWVASAQLLAPGSVADLLEAALQVGDSQALGYICEELPGAQHLQPEHMTKLLLAAMRQPDTTVLCRLCQLPAAQALQPADACSLLETALTDTAVCSAADAVCALCELLPGSQGLSAERLQQLLRGALPLRDGSTAAAYLCRLPAAAELRSAPGQSSEPDDGQELLAAHHRDAGACTPTSGSRSSSPSSGSGRMGRTLSCSSSSSSSSSPVSLRSRRSRHSTTSSSDGSFGGVVGAAAAALLRKQLVGSAGVPAGALQQQQKQQWPEGHAADVVLPEALEELLLPC